MAINIIPCVKSQLIKIGKVSIPGNQTTAGQQYTFTINDPEIRDTDIILTQLFILGATTNGVAYPRCNCSQGIAYLNFLSSENYTATVTIGFNYVILRPS